MKTVNTTMLLPADWRGVVRYRVEERVSINYPPYGVPAGFITDGATVPRWLWSVFPPVGRYFLAAVIHDHALVNAGGWRLANTLFDRALRAHGIAGWRRRAMLSAVRANGAYQKAKAKLGMEARHVGNTSG